MKTFRLNRVFSRPITGFLLKTPLTPNQITSLSLGLGVLAGTLFSKGGLATSFIGALSYQMAVLLDNCDGEVARAKGLSSVFGGWFDVVADFLTDVCLFLGIAIGLIRQNTDGPIVLFAILCISGGFLHFVLVMIEKKRGFGPAVFETAHPEARVRKNPFLAAFDAVREGDASWLVVCFALFGKTEYLLWLGGLYMQALWISAFFLNLRWIFIKKSFRENH